MSIQKHTILWIVCTCVQVTFFSCCIGNHKCNMEDYTARFRIISLSGNNLVFGPGRIYDKDSIRFYSLAGTDTVYHHYGAGPNPTPGGDSLLYVVFNRSKYETAYIRLNSTDRDTLQLRYTTIDGSPCCPDYGSLQGISVNNKPVTSLTGGISIINK